MSNSGRKIILGNAPSSGSTLLVGLIGAHDDIYQTRELNIFDKPDWIAGRTKDLKNNWSKYVKRGYDIHFSIEQSGLFLDFETIPDFAQSELKYAEFAVSELANLARKEGCNSFIEKTPNNIFSLPHLHKTLNDTFFIMIVRHPVSVYDSLRRRKYTPFLAVTRWYFANLIVYAMSKKPRTMVVKYEDLTQDPATVIKDIFKFLSKTPPPQSSQEKRSGNGSIFIESWTKDPHGPIVAEEVNVIVPVEMAAIFRNLRPSKYFFEYVGIEDPKLSPEELATKFGYETKTPGYSRLNCGRFNFPYLRYARYLAGCLKHQRTIRPLVHRWTK